MPRKKKDTSDTPTTYPLRDMDEALTRIATADTAEPHQPRPKPPADDPFSYYQPSRKPRIEVTERSQQTGLDVLLSDPRYKARLDNPFNEPTAPIHLNDDTRECRWFNAALASDHIWRNKRKGWDQVRPEDVRDLEQIGGYNKSPDGFITRGERGQEVLMSMPKVVRQAIQLQKTRQNNANMGNPNRTKAEIVNAAGQQIGSEAADYLNQRVGPVGEVVDTHERIERQVEE